MSSHVHHFQKLEKRRDSSSSRLKKLWRSPKQSASSATSDSGGESSSICESKGSIHIHLPGSVVSTSSSSSNNNNNNSKVACSLPLLQIWPSSDSPRGEADGQSFIFSVIQDDKVRVLSLMLSNVFYYISNFRDTMTTQQPSLKTSHQTTVGVRLLLSMVRTRVLSLFRFLPHPSIYKQTSQL